MMPIFIEKPLFNRVVLAIVLLAGLTGGTAYAGSRVNDSDISIENAEDKRTPLEKYQGAYSFAWLLCTLTQKQVFQYEKARARGITLSGSVKTDADVSKCIESGLAKMKKEYNNILQLVTNSDGKKALQEHYVAAIMHVKGTHSRPNENDSEFSERMNEAKRKTDELWVRFEIAQPGE